MKNSAKNPADRTTMNVGAEGPVKSFASDAGEPRHVRQHFLDIPRQISFLHVQRPTTL